MFFAFPGMPLCSRTLKFLQSVDAAIMPLGIITLEDVLEGD